MSTHTQYRVRPEWIDYNGHLSEGYYVLVFGFATDAVLDEIGVDAPYRSSTGCSVYTVEAHVRYLREVGPDSTLDVTSRVVTAEGKKLRICHEMSANGGLVATEELLAVHVDGASGRATRLPEHVAREAAALVEPLPEYAGRSVG
ncbi:MULTISPECIES: thioesterase family protein [Actinopolyspora]|uniref:Acyl-CoA thioester hydrolase n=1 Tax=Actinopolyspora saharensis TaxID=995062 RepID=A0A1H1A913_9ACTN|nr:MULTISPECIES: thioesterase family protein [Actinopolyspora]NHD16888.1 thioesterase [Actinopolyspora sp. BKK2]NHE76040.1 thioesterase [Actinopolyspora sp. BKK1]SDQ35981.1 acyl-CoA thioester hydrolase [Actinopolyspora saharensis]